MMKRKALVVALAVIGVALLLASIMVMSQDYGSCPEQPVGSPSSPCDHAYLINGTYLWMQPLYTGLGIASLVFLISAVVVALYLRFIAPDRVPTNLEQ